MSLQFKIGERVRVVAHDSFNRRSTVESYRTGSTGRTLYVLADGGRLDASELVSVEPRKLPTMPAAFDCSRTCPKFERVDVCRFSALFAAAGVRRVVNSHTVRVDVQLSNVDALTLAVERLGGRCIGLGKHRLFGSNYADGFGVQLSGWRAPIVVDAGGALLVDTWGNEANATTLEALRGEYAISAAELAARSLGWICERTAAGSLLVHHPNGGTLTVDAGGGVDVNGFNGRGCHEAASVIGSAMGKPAEFIAKPEFYNAEQRLTVAE